MRSARVDGRPARSTGGRPLAPPEPARDGDAAYEPEWHEEPELSPDQCEAAVEPEWSLEAMTVDGLDTKGWSNELISPFAADDRQQAWPAEVGGGAQDRTSPAEPEEQQAEFDELEENEFRLDRLPAMAQQYFRMGSTSWRDAVAEAIGAGIRNPDELADLIFFMFHPERMRAGTGKLIDPGEPGLTKLRAEWKQHRANATSILRSTAAQVTGAVFLSANPSKNYEDYVAAPTTGRITLLINGRDSGGPGPAFDQAEAFDRMQRAVEALQPGDAVYLAAWHFDPTVPLTLPDPAGVKTWGDLLQKKGNDGVKIRIIMTDFDPIAKGLYAKLYTEFLPGLNKLISQLGPAVRDNLKYIVSRASGYAADEACRGSSSKIYGCEKRWSNHRVLRRA